MSSTARIIPPITPRAPGDAQSLPTDRASQRAVLIGTTETVALAREQLALLPDSPEPIGCILLDKRTPRAAGGLPVFGGLDDLPAAAADRRINLAIVTLPAAMSQTINTVRAQLVNLGILERFLPPLTEMLASSPPYSVGLGQAAAAGTMVGGGHGIDVGTLIGRTPHTLDREAVGRILTGKRVLITGAGGSIGAELARLAAGFGPEQLLLLDRSENALFEIDRQIARKAPGVTRRAILHDIVDAEATLRLLVELRPHVVFHAAAHKHVPLMEDHPAHAVTNNLFGTRSIADAAHSVGAERFVMISTDKAVNPTSVMGATKRLAELYVHWLHETSRRMAGDGSPTAFSMVRFGNVIGSACSVLTIWSAQLAEGGPVTVTDPRMTRFFMTIPEAATLVMQAAALEADGPSAAVHVLDMGKPLPILDLARRFVRAHGFEPRVAGEPSTPAAAGLPAIDIVFTGSRAGEKLHEELAYGAECLRPTAHPGITAWRGSPPHANVAAMIADLSAVRSSSDRAGVLAAIRRHLPEMNPGA